MDYSLKNTNNQTSNLSTEDCSLPLGHGVALITVNSIVGVFGTFGNILVCLAVFINPRLRRSSNYLLFSLAIADLLVTMLCEPLVVAIFALRAFFHDCVTDLELAYRNISMLSCSASVVHMAAISIDRFIAVVYPLHHRSIMENCGLKPMLITCWAYPITVPILSYVIPENFPQGYLALAMFAVSYATILLCYSVIVVSLVKHRKQGTQIRARSSSDTSQFRVEIRVAFTLAIVIIVFTVCWFPLVAIMFAARKPLVKRHGVTYMWMRTLALSNSAMNFLIYGSRMQIFREAFAVLGQKIFDSINPKCSRTHVYNFTSRS